MSLVPPIAVLEQILVASLDTAVQELDSWIRDRYCNYLAGGVTRKPTEPILRSS